jgi:hypothetical protein
MNHRAKIILPALLLAALLFTGCRSKDTADISAQPASTPEVLSEGMGQIVISEFMEKNRATLQDEDGDFSDWIELYNQSTQTVSLSGWSISDKEEKSGWTFPDISLAPGEHLMLFASGKDKTGDELHTDFSLSGDEGLYLRNAQGELMTSALCGDCDGDVSLILQPDGSYQQCLYPTPGYGNSLADYAQLQQSQTSPSALIINEVMVYNKSFTTLAGEYYDWVELKNNSDQTINLSNYYLSDDKDDYKKCRLPSAELQPGELIVVYCTTETPILSSTLTVDFELDSENEHLFLTNAQEQLIDFVSLKDIPYGASFGRQSDENGWFYFQAPSPAYENAEGCRYVASSPTSPTEDGVFNDIDGLYVELEGEGTIRYTLDGSAPTESSSVYTEPIYIDSTTVIRASCFEDGAVPSRPLSLSFIINENHTLPVMSLVTDSPSSFDNMYNAGHKNVEETGSLSLYDENGSFTIPCGVSMNGETSLSMAKKNMSVRFRGAYGQSTLNYDIYGDGGVTEFTNLLLRSGQDYTEAIIRNELCQELAADASDNIINQRSKYCILYVNGRYYGIYTLKEKANEQLYASVAGVDRDSVTVLEAPVELDTDFYADIVSFCQLNDMSLDENYQHICDVLDIDSLIDWMILENYFANTDVASGNLRYCRSTENDGKWRLMFYDLDATFKSTTSVYMNLMTEYAQQTRQVSAFTVALMSNAQFKDKFLTRAAELFNTSLTVENVMAKIDELCAIVAPEVERDYARYNRTVEDWQYGVEALKSFIIDNDWQQLNIDNLCSVFSLSQTEREHYFG